jgi:hypothetical protein
MKLFRRSKSGPAGAAGGLMVTTALAGALVALPVPAAQDDEAPGVADSVPANPQSGVAPEAANPAYPPGVAEVLKMADAKVNTELIKAYIENSPTAYPLSASQIIDLRGRGLPDEVLVAMLQHNRELRAQGPQMSQPGAAPTAPTVPPAYPGGGYPYAPAPDYGYDYGAAPYTDYGYGGYPYGYPSYGYPYYGGYGYGFGFGWPFFVGFNTFGHHHFGNFGRFNSFHHGHFNNFAFHGGFHGGFNGGFHGGFGAPSPFHSGGSFSGHSMGFAVHGTFHGGGGGFHGGGGHGGGGGHR